MKSKYPLYYTLNQNMTNKEISNSKKKKLAEKLNQIEDYNEKKAIVMLIAEHAKVNDDLDIESEKIPYGILQKSDDVVIDIDKLPNDLQQILWKFMSNQRL